jgi:D-inositol-3-phosphate glycosyltransferase
MDIAMISEHASPLAALGGVDSGGQNVYVAQLARTLARRGHRIVVYTRRDAADLPPSVDGPDGVRIVHVDAGPPEPIPKERLLVHMGAFGDGVRGDMERRGRGFDLVHAHFFMSALVAAEIKRTMGVPFVVTFHALGRIRRRFQGAADTFPDARFEIEERVAAEANAIVAECPQDRCDLLDLYGADAERIHVVPCGYAPDELGPMPRLDARRELGLPEDEAVVLQLGRMVPRKGVETAIRGFAAALRRRPLPARMVIVGGNSERPDPQTTPEIGRLMQIAADEGIDDRVRFEGSRPRARLRAYYGAADVFVTTPWYEPFGITPVEAMACGVPTIGSAVGGIRTTVQDGETGFLVPPRDPAALAGKLAVLLHDHALRERMSRRALERARSFTWDAVTDEMERVYEAVVPRRTTPVADVVHPTIDRGFDESIAALQRSRTALRPSILAGAERLYACFARGGKVLACGNGGSAADAQHFVGEFVGRFKLDGRVALPALALTADASVLTGWANDVGFEEVFARQIEAFGRPGDVLVAISTSGASSNVTAALAAARSRGLDTIALLGRDGGDARAHADVPILVPSNDTARIQEVQMLVLHLLCELVETRVGVTTAAQDRAPRPSPNLTSVLTPTWDGTLRPRSEVRRTIPEADGRN